MKKQFFAFVTILLVSFSIAKTAFSAPVINEFSSSTSEDWIEIYNSGTETIDLNLYKLRDSSEKNKLDLSGSLPPQGFLTFDWSNKLNNGGDILKLVLILDESIVDQVSYGDKGGLSTTDSPGSMGRLPDGSSSWNIFSNPSRNLSNNSSSVIIPPSPTPTKTPISMKSSTVSKYISQVPTRAPTSFKISTQISNSPSLKSNNSVKITPKFKVSSNFTRVNSTSAPSEVKNKTEVLGAKDEKIPSVFLVGGFLLILLATGKILLKYFTFKEIYEKIFDK